jgi:nucleoside-diphosphate-sugar epimerase
MSGRRVLVVGGSGFIGTRLVGRLLRAGHEVRIADRVKSESHPDLWSYCDVREPAGLREPCRGVDIVFNLAAEHRDDVRPVSLYHEVNVEGARNLCAALSQERVQRLVSTSSVAVYGFWKEEVAEDHEKRPANPYGHTKLEAEGVYRAWCEEDPERSLVMVRPTVVFGEGNRGNVYNLLRQISSGLFLMVGDGRNQKSMAYVENVAAFLEHAMAFGAGTQVFNYVDKPDLDMNELVSVIRGHLGRSGGVPLRIPYAVGHAIGRACDLLARATRRSLPISAVRIEKFCADSRFAAERARASGFVAPIGVREALERTIAAEFGAASRA